MDNFPARRGERTHVNRAAFFAGLAFAASTLVAAAEARVPILLELFTSEGCSDCPPADKLLESLDQTQPIPEADLIVLSEHVDYWNRLGWRDPWSSAANSARQQDYGRRLRLPEVYTPQLVIDGAAEMVGSDASRITSELHQAARHKKLPIALSCRAVDGAHLVLHVEAGKGTGAVYAAVADDHVASQVQRGENAGRSLTHIAVLRELVPLGALSSHEPFTADKNLAVSPGALRVIVFVRDERSGRVLGAARQRVANPD
jgi:hypothetical protein